MKRIIICGFIVIVLIIIGAASFYCTDSAADDAARTVDDISRSFENGDIARVKSLTAGLNERWQSHAENDVFIMDKGLVSEITTSIIRLSALAEEQSPEISSECRSLKQLVLLYRDKNGLKLKNIF